MNNTTTGDPGAFTFWINNCIDVPLFFHLWMSCCPQCICSNPGLYYAFIFVSCYGCYVDEETIVIRLPFSLYAILSCSNQERQVQTLLQLAKNLREIYRQYSMCSQRTCSSFYFSTLKGKLFCKEVLTAQNFQGAH